MRWPIVAAAALLAAGQAGKPVRRQECLPHAATDSRNPLATFIRDRTLANKVAANAKGQELLNGLEVAFAEAAQLGAQRKAVIFTESRRTQTYLFDPLTTHRHRDQIVLMNATSADPLSAQIYHRWVERHRDTDAISGSATADRKAAIVLMVDGIKYERCGGQEWEMLGEEAKLSYTDNVPMDNSNGPGGGCAVEAGRRHRGARCRGSNDRVPARRTLGNGRSGQRL
jgi:hypothetical protein